MIITKENIVDIEREKRILAYVAIKIGQIAKEENRQLFTARMSEFRSIDRQEFEQELKKMRILNNITETRVRKNYASRCTNSHSR